MLVTKMTETVTNILKLLPTHFVSNIRHQHRQLLFTSFDDFLSHLKVPREKFTNLEFNFRSNNPLKGSSLPPKSKKVSENCSINLEPNECQQIAKISIAQKIFLATRRDETEILMDEGSYLAQV